MTGSAAIAHPAGAASPAWATGAGAVNGPAARRPSPAGRAAQNHPATGVDGRPRRASTPVVSADELTVLRYIADGLPIDAVAHRMGTSPRTVRRRMRNLCDRIGATCAIQAVVWAAHRGLV